jgi:hypothetical protein
LKGCGILDIKKFVGVKHKPEQKQVYWFEVPEPLCNSVKMNSQVLCDTSRGRQEGVVVSIVEGVGENKAQHIIGARFPLKEIVAVKVSLDIDKIHIPYDIQAYGWDLKDIYETMEAYFAVGYFSGSIKFSVNNDLIDGYSEYLIAKMFDHGVLEGWYVVK